MNRLILQGIQLLLAAWSSAAFAQSMTYDFTGVSYAESGNYAGVMPGTLVTGTLTYNYSAPTYINDDVGVVGSSYFDLGTAYGGVFPGTSTAVLFSMTTEVDGISYSTLPAAADNTTNSYIFGSYSMGVGSLTTVEGQSSGCNVVCTMVDYGSAYIVNSSGAAYTSEGFPLFTPSPDDLGIVNTNVGYDYFTITSLTPVSMVTAVPEQSTDVMMLAGLMLLGGLAHSKRRIALRLRQPSVM